jgi:glycosyltransferase involved in cell wall biosynthesis
VKGPDRFIDLATAYCGDAGFVVIGSGSMESVLRDQVMAQSAKDRVAFMGEVPDAMGYLRQLDMLVVPSRHEGFPMILLEAAACEVPVVAFDVGGVREVLNGAPAEWLVKAGDMNRFGESIRMVLQNLDSARAAAVRWAASARAGSSPTTVTAAYRTIYDAAAANSSPAWF